MKGGDETVILFDDGVDDGNKPKLVFGEPKGQEETAALLKVIRTAQEASSHTVTIINITLFMSKGEVIFSSQTITYDQEQK